MAKEIKQIVKMQLQAGAATPAPPVGTALGPAGVNIMGFCKEFNAKTQERAGDLLPVVITVYSDKSFTFITKEPPVSALIKKELDLKSGSKVPNRDKVGKLTRAQVGNIVAKKRRDMRVNSDDAAARLVAGTARSMGVDVEV